MCRFDLLGNLCLSSVPDTSITGSGREKMRPTEVLLFCFGQCFYFVKQKYPDMYFYCKIIILCLKAANEDFPLPIIFKFHRNIMSQIEKGEENIYNEKEQTSSETNTPLTEEDKEIYLQLLSSIGNMNLKIKKAQHKLAQKDVIKKQTETKEVADKIIEGKQKQGLQKKNLSTDIHDSFERVVLDVYSENEQLKKKIKSLVAIMREQTKKIREHKEKEGKLELENEEIRNKILELEGKKKTKKNNNIPENRKKRNENDEDEDFWKMDIQENHQRKRKIPDSALNLKERNENLLPIHQ